MIRIALIIFALCNQALAQDTSGLGVGSGAATPYVGPGDLATATIWYGLRAYNNAYAVAHGNIAIFRRSSDNATCTAVANTGGGMDLVTASCTGPTNLQTFCSNGGGNCFASTIYDQAGSHYDVTQSNTAKQAELIFDCWGNQLALPPSGRPTTPCLWANVAPTNGVEYDNTTSLTQAQPFTIAAVANRQTSGSSQNSDIISCGTVNAGFSNGGDQTYMQSGPTAQNTTATDFDFHALQYVFNGASSITYVDGTATTGLNPGTNSCVNNIHVFDGFDALQGYVLEVGVWNGALSATVLGNLNANQVDYWGPFP